MKIRCSTAGENGLGSGTFWMINGSTYGLLQVPTGFVVCNQIFCDPTTLQVPVLQIEMDDYVLQCVSIDYNSNILFMGGETVLDVIPLPQGQYSSKSKSQHTP